jgi:flagellin
MSKNNKIGESSLQKLSSGLRINTAADDPAGLSISEKMRSQISGLDQASTNAQDGISLIQTAEGALNETTDILQRMRELAVQAANDTATTDDRTQIQDEMNQLRQEIDRIADTTEFNTKSLLNGSLSKTVTDSGTDAASFVDSGYKTTGSTEAGVYTVTFTSAAMQANVAAGDTADALSTTTVANATTALGLTGDIVVNNSTITLVATDTLTTVAEKINNANGSTGITASTGSGTDTASATKGFLELTSDGYGSDSSVQISGASATLLALGITASGDASTVISDAGTDAVATLTGDGTYTQSEAAGNVVTFSNGLTVTGLDGTVGNADTATVTVGSTNALDFQIGANENQNLSLTINNMNADSLGVNGSTSTSALSIGSYEDAKAAITTIDAAIASVSAERGNLGAVQNRLDHTINNLTTTSENLTAAESRIRDVDMASEMMEYTKMNILSQAAQSMLAQANQAPEGVLQLLQ